MFSKKLNIAFIIGDVILDAIGVNTTELSDMVYKAREYGAKGSKLTGSGGGGCIIAYTPENSDEIYKLSLIHI